MKLHHRSLAALVLFSILTLTGFHTLPARSADWPQWGGSPARNNASPAKGLPVRWDVGKTDSKSARWLGSPDKQILWVAHLGSESYATPVVSGDKVFCATDNAGYSPRYPASVDLGCLVAFARKDGSFLWQLSREKLAAGRNIDWPKQGICSTPVVEGNRLWIVTNRSEVLCLDTEGFRDGKNDGPVTDEPSAGKQDADIVWAVDMMKTFGSVPRYMTAGSPTVVGNLLLVGTSNGVDPEGSLQAPTAPSFLALDKRTGKLVWSDASPGRNLLEGQWASPASAQLAGTSQAIFAGGDGWLYSFLDAPTADQKAQLLWRFDCNPKDAAWESGGAGRRNYIIATPVIHEGRVYVGTGQDPEAGEGPADLWCIDPSRRGDVSPELVVDRQGQPVPHRRIKALDKAAGEQAKPNPQSAVVWHYQGSGAGSGGEDFAAKMHRTLSSPTLADGLLVIGDFAGLVHCLDAKTGRALWTHDLMAELWGGALVADGKIYVGNADGDVTVFELGRQKKVLAKNEMGNSVHGAPVAADDTLYISTRTHLYAIRAAAK
jgi:outer membrane protein assembly factor BamB